MRVLLVRKKEMRDFSFNVKKIYSVKRKKYKIRQIKGNETANRKRDSLIIRKKKYVNRSWERYL